MQITSIVGARPQFVKMAVVCRAIEHVQTQEQIEHRIIHTGQHYDNQMSAVFFSELGIPDPSAHLGVGSGSHGEQTGEMLKRLESVLSQDRPDCVLLYGDTNSTLAGAIVCAKLHIPAAHIEAGLRSYNRRMPEEINRLVADQLSELLFCPTSEAMLNLQKEGMGDRAILSGDIMYDAALYYSQMAEARGGPIAQRFAPHSFALATIHRAENTDDPRRLRAIFSALESIASDSCQVVLPLHPRTLKCIEAAGIQPGAITLLPPVSYLEMLLLESRARFIVTDSGGVQKEAYFVKVPCITTRDETEWVETLENGCNVLTGADTQAILAAANNVASAGPWGTPYGDGNSCGIILRTIAQKLKPHLSTVTA
jgi:UDP-GlcNAc3NAcA epimerase